MILSLWQAALRAVAPTARVAACLGPDGPPVHLFGAGKAAEGMGIGARSALRERLVGGVLLGPRAAKLGPVQMLAADHPLPTQRSRDATQRLLLALQAVPPDHTVIFLVSGGASAMLCAPTVSLPLWRDLNDQLLRSGAPIRDVNTVRAAFSEVKGGRLAARCPVPFETLILSDVPGDDPTVVGSGPTALPRADDVLSLAQRWRIRLPGEPSPLPATVPSGRMRVVARNDDAVQAAATEARARGRKVVFGAPLTGPADEAGRALARQLVGLPPQTCLITGGETTVTVHGRGSGGRSQELITASLRILATRPGCQLLAAGTDGRDGPTDAAGAIADATTLSRLAAQGLSPEDALAANDTHPFLARGGALLYTGETGTNVMDLVIGLTP